MIKKIIIIGILINCIIGNAIAWDSEGGFAENETYEIIWNDELQCFEYKDINNPSIYSKITGVWFTIKSFFLNLVGINISYDVDKYEWDGTVYQETDSDTFSWDLSHDANHTETTVSTFDPVEEYFKGNDTRVEDWDGDDPNHPDILNVTVTIDGDGETLDDSNYGYVTLSDSTAKRLGGGTVNYGFDNEGKGGGGGSGSIYEGINLYDGTGNSAGVQDAFNMIFWLLIPMIFIICVLKFSMRMFT